MKHLVLYTAYAVLFTTFGYLYGYYQGSHIPQVDRTAINSAVYQAMMEQ